MSTPRRPTFLSDRVKVNPPTHSDPLRYSYLNLENAEPNLGIPVGNTLTTINNYTLATDLTGKRFFISTSNWDSSYTSLRSNSALWLTLPQANSIYFKTSGGSIVGQVDISGNLVIEGNFTVVGTFSALSATFTTTLQTLVSSLSVVAAGTGPALFVGTKEGDYDIAVFKDLDNGIEVLKIVDVRGGDTGKVGINVSDPTHELTIRGSLSANGVAYIGNYNSQDWSSTYITISTLSADFVRYSVAPTREITFNNLTTLSFISAGGALSSTGGIYTWGDIVSGGRNIAQFLQLQPGLDVEALISFLSTNNLLLSTATFQAGVSVRGGLSADVIYADLIYGQLGTVANYPADNFIGDGVTTDYYLSETISSANDILVYVSGIYQDKATYSIDPGPYTPYGSKITFTEPPPAPDTGGENNIEVVIIKANPVPIGSVADGSITTQKLANNAITIAKVRTGNFITSAGGTIYGNLSVVGSISASQYFLTNAALFTQAFDVFPGQTTFNLLSAVNTVNDILVFVSGVYQRKDTYTLSNNKTLVLDTIPPVGSKVVEVQYLRYFPYTLSVPAPGTVINSSIGDRAITINKLSGVFITTPPISFVGDGTTTTFTLLCATTKPTDIDVYFSGIYQNKASYSVPNNYTLSFLDAPPSGAQIEVTYRQVQYYNTYPTIDDNTVTTPKIVNQAVTSDKLATNISIYNNFAVGGNTNIAGQLVVNEIAAFGKSVTVNNDLLVYGSLTALGDTTFIDTRVTTTSALSVINNGTGPALTVQQSGPEAVARFIDRESGDTLFIGNNQVVGVNTNNPQFNFHVIGSAGTTSLSTSNIFASNTIISAGIDIADRLGDVNTGYSAFHGIKQALVRYTNVNPFSASWNLYTQQVGNLFLSAYGNTLLQNPTNQVAGGTYVLMVRTLSGNVQLFFDTAYKFPDSIAPTLTQSPSSMDIFTFISDGRNMYGTSVQNYSWA